MITVCAGPVVGRNVPPVATGLKYWCTLGEAVAAPTTPVPATTTSAHPHIRARCAVREFFGHSDMRSSFVERDRATQASSGVRPGKVFDAIGAGSFRQGRYFRNRAETRRKTL